VARVSRRRVALISPLVVFALVVVAWFVYSRHVPWVVPTTHRPPATWKGAVGLKVRFLGVSGYEVSDGTTTVLLDPTPTRPDPLALITGRIDADPALGERWCPKADLVLINHAHFDHALDVGAIGKRTGALVAGSQNTVNLARSRGVSADKTRVVRSGEQFTVGTFTIDVRGSRHTDILVANPMSGTIAPDAGPMWFWSYALDETFAYRLTSTTTGATLWFHPTSTWAPGELGGLPAQTLIVGVTGEQQTAQKIAGLLGEAHPARVLPTHYDNFFQPLDKGLALMPSADLDAVKRLFLEADPKLEWGVLDFDETVTLP
jgi:L-ascorbate metabolism protein UlaG (beta-lactamase superfamily)